MRCPMIRTEIAMRELVRRGNRGRLLLLRLWRSRCLRRRGEQTVRRRQWRRIQDRCLRRAAMQRQQCQAEARQKKQNCQNRRRARERIAGPARREKSAHARSAATAHAERAAFAALKQDHYYKRDRDEKLDDDKHGLHGTLGLPGSGRGLRRN